jgi:threonine dehydratase
LATRTAPTLADIQAARGRIAGVARVTPIFTSETLSGLAGRELLLKCENFQRTGAVKVRGAVNKIATLSDAERRAGVVAATAGNHGQAVAWAAREAGIRATIFMPRDTPMAKVGATQRYGAVIELNATGLEEAFEAAQAYAAETGATFVHAYEDEVVIAGQGTIALELVDQLPGVETVVVPIGGGGLASGIAIALGELRPEVRIVGVQAAACAPFAGSKKHGFTIAEGIAVKRPGELTSAILRDRLEEVVTVTDEQISQAIVLLLERAKVVVEGAGAAPVASVLAGVVPGGNIDSTLLIEVIRHGLTSGGRYLVVRTKISDRPGELVKLLELVAEERVNVVSVEHHREGMAISIAESEVELTLITRDQEHCTALLARMREWGYPVERVR